MLNRPYNFSAGPAGLPLSVLEKIQSELLNWKNTGASVMEVSHRGKEFMAFAEKMQADFRRILNVPKEYDVLFLHGGARAQFSMIPMNLLAKRKSGASLKAAYAVTGHWSHLAAEEAETFCLVNSVVDDESTKNFTTIPPVNTWKIDDDAAYLYYCDNETIHGVEFYNPPTISGLPLVCDMSSSLFSHPIDVSKYGLIYSCAQKNMGIAGVTAVIVHQDLVGEVLPNTPSMMDYGLAQNMNSMLNTPSTFAWYVLGLVLEWMDAQGGLTALAECNALKSKILYDFVDQSGFYSCTVDPKYRSHMNVVFRLPNENQNAAFLAGAEKNGLMALKGHREIGGMRASIYNAMPVTGVQALVSYMKDFMKAS